MLRVPVPVTVLLTPNRKTDCEVIERSFPLTVPLMLYTDPRLVREFITIELPSEVITMVSRLLWFVDAIEPQYFPEKDMLVELSDFLHETINTISPDTRNKPTQASDNVLSFFI